MFGNFITFTPLRRKKNSTNNFLDD